MSQLTADEVQDIFDRALDYFKIETFTVSVAEYRAEYTPLFEVEISLLTRSLENIFSRTVTITKDNAWKFSSMFFEKKLYDFVMAELEGTGYELFVPDKRTEFYTDSLGNSFLVMYPVVDLGD